MQKTLTITFLLFSGFIFSQEDQNNIEKSRKTNCKCNCEKRLDKYDELIKLKEIYNNDVISSDEYKAIHTKIIRSLLLEPIENQGKKTSIKAQDKSK